MTKVTESTRRNWFADLTTSFSNGYVEVTEWSNMEGVDIEICADHNLGDRTIRLTYEELDAIVDIYNEMNRGLNDE